MFEDLIKKECVEFYDVRNLISVISYLGKISLYNTPS